MYVRFNDLAPNQSDEVVWYYVAGSSANINSIVAQAAQAAGAFQNRTCSGATYEATSSVSATGYWLVVPDGSSPPTELQIKNGVNYGTTAVISSGSDVMVGNVSKVFNVTGLNGQNGRVDYDFYFVTESPDPNNINAMLFSPINVESLATDDQVSPNVITQNISIQLDAQGQASIVATDIDNGSTDDCASLLTYSVDQTNFTCADGSTVNVMLTVTDGYGNVGTGSAVVSITNAAPLAGNLIINTESCAFIGLDAAPFETAFTGSNPGDTLQAIRFTSLPTAGFLTFNGVHYVLNQSIPKAQISQLRYSSDVAGNFNFTYQSSAGCAWSANGTVSLAVAAGSGMAVNTSAGTTRIPARAFLTRVDSLLTVSFPGTVNGARVSIETNFNTGDQLTMPVGYAYPAGVSGSYNASAGVFTVTGNMTASEMQGIFRELQFTTTSTVITNREIAFIIGSALYEPFSGHYYEIVTGPEAIVEWEKARVRAKYLNADYGGSLVVGNTRNATTPTVEQDRAVSNNGLPLQPRTINGLQGYLANITSLDEHQFLRTRLTGVGWLGGSDVDLEGTWRWMDGPEKGQTFWNSSSTVRRGDNTINSVSMFNYWSDNEPNNSGGEHWAEFGFGSSGVGSSWNDCQNNCGGRNRYVIEYGGMAGDITSQACFNGTARKQLVFNQLPTITSVNNQVTCPAGSFPAATFTVGDAEDTASLLTVTATSDRLSLVPNANIVVTGSGANRTVQVTHIPGQTSFANITLTVSDAEGETASTTFMYVNTSGAPVFSYTAPSTTVLAGETTLNLAPSISSGTITRYAVNPAVSTYGLNFNTATGVISGIPSQGFNVAFTITGTDTASGCPSTTTLQLEVLECYPVNPGDYVLRGSANQTALTNAYVEYQLTPAAGSRFGAAWNQRRLNLNEDFNIITQVNLGTIDASGADGLAFVLQPLSTNQGSSGGGLGYAGISPSFAVEFDTWQNSGDPSQDHIALMLNGNTSNHTQVPGTNANTTLGNLEDGAWRSAQYIWTAATKNFKVIVAGNTLFNVTYDLVANVFRGNPDVYWGYTAATGGAINDQRVRFERYCLERAVNAAPQVTTDTLAGQTSTTATIGTTAQDGGDNLTARGVIFSATNQNPQLNTAGIIVGASVEQGGGADTTVYGQLLPGTFYYARGYATNSSGNTYGNVISFWTAPQDLTATTTTDFIQNQNAHIICFGASTQLQATGVQGDLHWFTASCGGTLVGTGNNLVVQPSVTTTYFGRNFFNGLYSNNCSALTVVVRPQIVPQTISGAETICWNSRPVGFTGTAVTGGTGPWTYQWQQREFLNGVWGAWTNIAQATNFAAYRPDFMFTTTEFRLLATDTGSPACSTNASSNVITVTVRDPFTPSVISVNNGAYAFCENDQLTLTATPTLGGSGPPFQYQWQQSSDSINWVNVGPAQNNQINLVVSNLSADTYYRLIAFDLGTPGCGSVFSINGFKVFVQPTVLAGGISGSQHICAQTAPAAITSTNPGAGRGTLSYRWESSQNGGTSWNTIAGANAVSYQPGVLTTTTDFRRYTISTFQGAACESPLAADSTIRILVDSLPIAQVFGQLRDTACVNAPYQLMGGYSSNGTRAWSHNGVGSLSSATALQPIYTPVAADAGNVVQFTMVVTGSQICGLTTDTARFDLLIDSLPYAIAGVADTICSNGSYQVVGASAAYGTVQWSHNGAGTLQQANTLTPTYVAAAGDEGNRVRLILSVTSNNTCVGLVDRDTVFVSVDPLPVAVAGGSNIICAGTSSQISGASAQHGTILWTIDAASGRGTILNATTLTPTYVADTLDAGSTVRLKMTVTSTNTCNPQTAVAYFDVVVRPNFVSARLVNQNQELCYNTSARVITAQPAVGGTGPYGYQWQISADSTTWTNIAGAINLTYTQPGIMTATRYYRILSTDLGNPVCGTIVSSTTVAKITVFEPLTPPLFASNQITVCNGTSAVILPQPARGGRNDFRYQWQQSANGTTGWVNVGSPSQSLQFSSPALTSGTYYRVIGRDEDFPNGDPSCGSVFSNAVHIIVADPAVAGAITGTQTICLGSTAAVIQSQTPGTGSGTVSYAWEANAGQGWSRIAGATLATYNAGALTTTTQFRRFTVATFNGVACESVASNAVTITVDNPAQFTAASQGDTTLMALASVCSASAFNYQVAATAPSAITYTYSMSGATVDTGAGTGSGRVFNVGVTAVRVYAATNCAVSVRAFNVTVNDTVRPTIVAQNITVNLNANGQAVITPAMVNNGSSDNCGIASSTLSATSFTCANVGANQVTFTVTDVNGNVRQANVVVTVVDAILPTVVAQPLTVFLNAAGQASITAAMVDNGSSDNCGIPTRSLSQTNFSCSNVGANNITFTVTDVNGNTNQAVAVITVRDTLKPIVLARNLRVALNASGQANITAAMVDSGSTDNCAIATRALTMSSFSCANVGANNVTLTVTDVNGNAQTATVVVTVIDTVRPTIVAQNITVNLDASGQAVITPAMVDNGSSDNCSIASRTLNVSSFSCANVGANPVTFTVTDVNGNVRQANVVVTVVDADTPIVRVQNRTVFLDANGAGQLTAAQIDAGSSDNCAIAQRQLSKTQFGCADIGTNVITFTVTDVHGNVGVNRVNVVVADTIAPVVTSFATDTLYVTRDACAALYYWRDSISVFDACGSFTVQSVWPNVILLNKGQHQLNFTVTDIFGNARAYSRPVVVIDTIRPTILNVPANVTIYAGANCGRTYTWVPPTPSDNCTGITMTSNFNSGDFFPLGTTQVQYFVTDAVGLTNQASFTITVVDTTPPSILAQNLIIALDANGQSNITVGMVNTGTSDNCGIATLALSRTNFNCTHVGANNVIFTATDVHGNISQATVVVTVVDNFPPVARTRNLTAYLGINGLVNITAAMVDSGSSDNCGIASMTISKTSFNCSNTGLNNVTFSVIDLYGNTALRTVTVNVLDTIKPVIQLAADTITAYLGSNQCLASVSLTGIQITDNCGAPTVVTSSASGAAFSVGITPVSITATDASGNQRQRMLYVRVLDTIAPVIVGMPTTVTMAYDSLQCGAVVSWAQPVAIDNCATGLSSNLVSGTFFGVGSHTVIYTATDPSGNSTQRSIQFTVNDVFAPRWTSVPASITLIAASNSCSAVASWTTPTATDNCSSVTMGGSHTSGSTFPVGITTVVLTATDAAGNVANHSFTVTVRDTIAPTVVSMPGNAVLGICQATFNYPAPTATDACGTVTISQISGLASGSVFPLGTTTNVFRFTDASGNTVTASFTVTVQSTSLPFVPVNLSFCSNDTVQDLSRGYTGYVFFGNGISNSIFFNPAQAVVGNQAIDFTFTDSIGCSTSGRIIISVSPSPLKPVIERVNATTLRARDVYDAYQWYRYDQPIFGATQQSYVVSVSGVYTLKVSNNFGCEVFSDPFGFGVGINVEELGKDGFNIYPNPNKGRFFVHHAFDDLQTRTILVLDMLGKVVYQQESNTAVTELDLAHLAQGRYFVRIESEKELGIKSVIIRY
jgi:hypothetical protein